MDRLLVASGLNEFKFAEKQCMSALKLLMVVGFSSGCQEEGEAIFHEVVCDGLRLVFPTATSTLGAETSGNSLAYQPMPVASPRILRTIMRLLRRIVKNSVGPQTLSHMLTGLPVPCFQWPKQSAFAFRC